MKTEMDQELRSEIDAVVRRLVREGKLAVRREKATGKELFMLTDYLTEEQCASGEWMTGTKAIKAN